MSAKPRVVVGAVIVRAGRVLAARRTRPAELAGYWEFPGGKTEDGEDPRDALVREISEELAASIEVFDEVRGSGAPWPISDTYVLRLYLASVARGEPRPGQSASRSTAPPLQAVPSTRAATISPRPPRSSPCR